jgi:hypothetical protein
MTDTWKDMVKMFFMKLIKSEWWAALVAGAVAALATKIGIPEEYLMEFYMFLLGLATIYIGGRSYAKPREMKALAEAGMLKKDP